MSDTIIGNGGSFSSLGSFTYIVDYDSTANLIGIACAGVGHANLKLIDTSNGNVLTSMYCDQYGATAGPVAQAGSTGVDGKPNAGESASPVTYDNTRHIIAGPGSAGIDVNGAPLPTTAVQGNVVKQLNPPKGQLPSLLISLDWHP